MLLFLVYPVFAVAVFVYVESIPWKAILIAAAVVAFFYPPFNIIVPVAGIIGIGFVRTLKDSGLM